MLSPIEKYQQALASGDYRADPGQRAIIETLQMVYLAWHEQHLAASKSVWKKLTKPKVSAPVRGLYLWGGVGAGKTWLMDLFYDCIPEQLKMRLHFHRFMQRIHQELTQRQGQADPLKLIAKQLAQQIKLIFLDEFVVNDITDAMLLANLLQALFNEGVTLMATSNVPPEGLYRNGLQRNRFLPAIALLNRHMQVFKADIVTDYRLRTLEQAGVYFCPLNSEAEQHLMQHYLHLAHDGGKANEPLLIEGRAIATRWLANEVVWFDFAALCHIPRSQLDYVEIARIYSAVILSNVPQIAPEQDNIIIYLIHLVDILYDARVKLIISAAAPVEELYLEGRYAFEFQRTRSRLLEMQSTAYLSAEHTG